MYDIIIKFRVRLAGLIPTEESWVEFYEKTQKFVTLCRNCLILKEIRNYLDASKTIGTSDKSSSLEFAKQIKQAEGKPKRLYKDIIQKDIKGRFKAIMVSWLGQARSNLLHRGSGKGNGDEVEEIEKVGHDHSSDGN